MSTTMLSNNTGVAFGQMWRRGPNGKPVTVEADRSEYAELKTGPYTFELTGISDIFEMDISPQYQKPGGQTKKNMVRVEVTVREPAKRAGLVFSDLMTASLHETANLGKVSRAILGRDLEPSETFDGKDLLGGLFVATVVPNQTGTRNKLGGDSIVKVDSDDDDEPVPVAAPAAAKIGGNPYLDSDE